MATIKLNLTVIKSGLTLVKLNLSAVKLSLSIVKSYPAVVKLSLPVIKSCLVVAKLSPGLNFLFSCCGFMVFGCWRTIVLLLVLSF